MLSFIEVGFYLSLAVMLCLLFLLINHLKSRIITLENQNEGVMDVMKMIRGNLVTSDREQKKMKDSIVSLAKNISYISAVVTNNEASMPPPSRIRETSHITLEVEDLYSKTMAEAEDTDEDEEEESSENPDNELEVVNIEWPSNEEIEIRKLSTDDFGEFAELSGGEFTALSRDEIQHHLMMSQMNSPMFMNSSNVSELQKMFFMMSMDNGVPTMIHPTAIFENIRVSPSTQTHEYEILPDDYADPDVEELPDSPMPELEPMEHTPDLESIERALDLEQMKERIDQLIRDIIPQPLEPDNTPISEPIGASEEAIPEAEEAVEIIPQPLETIPEAEEAVEIIPLPLETVPEMESTTEEKEIPMDFSKMDLRTLRSLVSTQGTLSQEKVSKMKKNELIRILSDSNTK